MIVDDCVFNIFGYLTVEELSKARLVNSSQQTIADHNSLWRSHLQNIKGKDFTACILENPRNFICLDQQLTKIFNKVVNKKKHILADHPPKLSAYNLDEGSVMIEPKDMDIEIYMVRLSKENIDVLKHNSCLEYEAWIKTIKKIADSLYSQLHHQWSSKLANSPGLLLKLKAEYKNPGPKMKQFIKYSQITDLFILKNGNVYISSKKHLSLPFGLSPIVFENKQEENSWYNLGLISSFVKARKTNDLINGVEYLAQILYRLYDSSTNMCIDFMEFVEKNPEHAEAYDLFKRSAIRYESLEYHLKKNQ